MLLLIAECHTCEQKNVFEWKMDLDSASKVLIVAWCVKVRTEGFF